jgi:hypothetical protein
MRKFRLSLMALMSLMVIGAFALGACAPAATPEPPTEEPMEEPMEEPTEEPMEEPMEEPELCLYHRSTSTSWSKAAPTLKRS